MITVRKLAPFFAIVLLIIFIKNNVSSILNSFSNSSTTQTLKNQLEKEKKENTFLKEQLKYVKSDQFVGEEAENKLGLLKPGEVFVIAPTGSPLDNRLPVEDERPNWKKWFELFF